MYFKSRIYLFIILIIALCLRLIILNQSFWLDEAAQVIESARPLIQQFDIKSDFHPPLFHVMLHFWMYLGNSETWIRLLSVGLSVLSILTFYLLAKQFLSKKYTYLATLLLTISPYHIWYSQEARPYMLFLVMSLLSTYFLIKRNWLVYAGASILMMYTLYFAPFLLIAHGIYIHIFDRKKYHYWLKTLAVIGIMFLPWLPKFIEQLKIGTNNQLAGWMQIVSVSFFKAIPLTLAKFIFGKGSIDNNFIYGLVVIPVLIIFIWSVVIIWQKKGPMELLIWFIIPIILALSVTLFIPVIAPQRLIFLLPIFYLILISGIKNFTRSVQLFSVGIICLTSLGGIFQYYTNPYVQREHWRQAVSFVENQHSANSLALFAFPEPFAPWQWYSRNVVPAIGLAHEFKIDQDILNQYQTRLIRADKIFYFHYLADLTDPNQLVINYLNGLGFVETTKKDYPGVGFVSIYEKVLAHN